MTLKEDEVRENYKSWRLTKSKKRVLFFISVLNNAGWVMLGRLVGCHDTIVLQTEGYAEVEVHEKRFF